MNRNNNSAPNHVLPKPDMFSGTQLVWDLLNMEESLINPVETIQFNTGTTETTQSVEGQLRWSSKSHTLNVGLSDGVNLQVGQESVVPAINITGSVIPNGAVVYINGAESDFPTIQLADNRYEITSDQTLGVVTSNFGIAPGSTGFVCSNGLVHDLVISYSAGTVIYLGQDGNFTDVRVHAPLHNTIIGRTINDTTIIVAVQLGVQLADAHDVIIENPVDGQTIIYDNGYFVNQVTYDKATGFPNHTDSEIIWDNSTYTLTVQPTGEFYYIYNQGRRFTITQPYSITINNNVSQINYVYFDANGVLQNSSGLFPNLLTSTLVSFISWNAILQDGICFEERHSTTMDVATHLELHEKIGTYVVNGFGISNYTLNTTTDVANRWTISNGIVADEDIRYNQESHSGTGYYTNWYKSGTTATWLYTSGQTNPFHFTTASYINYNQYVGGSWTLTSVGPNNYVNYYVFVTNAITDGGKQYLIIPGQQVYATKALATAENIAALDITGLPIIEFASLYRITYETKNDYGTIGKVNTVQVDRVIGYNITVQASSFLNNHSVLSNLTTDDHKQYELILGDTHNTTFNYSGLTITGLTSIDTRGTAETTIYRTGDYVSSVITVKNGLTTTTTITRDIDNKIINITKV